MIRFSTTALPHPFLPDRVFGSIQFPSRMVRAKNRIAELDTKIKDDTGDADRLEHLRLRRNAFVNSRQPSGRTSQTLTGIAVET